MKIRELRDDEAWDAAVRSAEGWTPFHLTAWRRVMERVFGHPTVYLAALSGGDVEGVLPLVWVRSPVFGRYLVSMPFVSYGGPLGTTEAVRALAGAAEDRARDGGADLLELRSRVPLDIDLPASHRKITVVLDLPDEDPEPLWKAIGSKLRNKVRRPGKEGIGVRFGPEQVRPFFEVFGRHMRDLGTPTQPLALFEAIAGTFGDDAWFGCAWLGDRPVAAGCGFRWADEFELTWSSALREYGTLRVNELLYWSFIERACREGLRTFNFGRSTPGSGTHEFKKQWGARDEALWWYQRSDGRAATPSPDDERFALGPRIWRRLPVSLTNRLGPGIVRYIP